jgi:hypothetical protein
VAIPTIATTSSKNNCNRTTDYNKDGLINSLDYGYCVKNGSGSSTPVATSTPTKCADGVDYNKDGTVNALDRIRCLQTK